MNADFQYLNADDSIKSGMYDVNYEFKLKNDGGQWFIVKIDSDLDDFKNFTADVNKKLNKGVGINKAIIETTEEKIKDIDTMKVQFKEALSMSNEKAQNKSEGMSTTAATSYIYYSLTGVSYAERFAGAAENDRFFYTTKDDCTNFVSQCVWVVMSRIMIQKQKVTLQIE